MQRSFAVVLGVLALSFAFPTLLRADVKIDAQDVGPGDAQLPYLHPDQPTFSEPRQDGRYYLSPHGAHLVTVTHKGSRFVVIYDGVTGPKYDQIMPIPGTANDNETIVFSPDGARYGYVGRSGDDCIVMIDGKDSGHIRAQVGLHAGFHNGTKTISAMGFFPNGKHVYFLTRGSGTGDGQFFIDGQPGAVLHDFSVSVFSADSEHLAYIDGQFAGQFPPQVYVDNKPAGYAGADPFFTPDSKHLFTRGRNGELMIDGKVWLNGSLRGVYHSPTGKLVVVSGSEGGAAFLVVGGKKVAVDGAAAIHDVIISADGAHYAAVCENVSHSAFMFIDAKKGDDYASIDNFAFAPDNLRWVYRANSGGKQFIVWGDDESDGFSNIDFLPVFGGGGKHLGFVGRAQNDLNFSIVIDGKATLRQCGPDGAGYISFSPDGSRWAFVAGHTVVVDGVDQKGLTLQPSMQEAMPKYVWSPDGKHVAFFASLDANPDKRGVAVDGHLVSMDNALSGCSFTFTPDGNHLFWITRGPGVHSHVYVDGQKVGDYDGTWPGSWEMGSDGTLTFLTVSADTVKRVRVAAPPDTNITTMLGAAH